MTGSFTAVIFIQFDRLVTSWLIVITKSFIFNSSTPTWARRHQSTTDYLPSFFELRSKIPPVVLSWSRSSTTTMIISLVQIRSIPMISPSSRKLTPLNFNLQAGKLENNDLGIRLYNFHTNTPVSHVSVSMPIQQQNDDSTSMQQTALAALSSTDWHNVREISQYLFSASSSSLSSPIITLKLYLIHLFVHHNQ